MKIDIFPDFDQLSQWAANRVVELLRVNKKLLLCPATGKSPKRMYEQLVVAHASEPNLFDEMRIVKLDEWGGVAMNTPGTCEWQVQQQLIQPMAITNDRFISFYTEAPDPIAECSRIQAELDKNGPIDLCILGVGMNGHLALNEPHEWLHPDCHVASLCETTMQHSMIFQLNTMPKYGLTLGMSDILKAKEILLLVSGSSKQEVMTRLQKKEISTDFPASFLWLHPNVRCLVDADAWGNS